MVLESAYTNKLATVRAHIQNGTSISWNCGNFCGSLVSALYTVRAPKRAITKYKSAIPVQLVGQKSIKSAFAVDIDANAIKTAYENADLSGVDKSKYYVTSGNVIDDKALQDEIGYDKYDVVVANIIADVICAISPVVPKQLKKGGVFIASGIIKDRIDDVYKALAEVGLKVIDTSIKDEWVSITSIKE